MRIVIVSADTLLTMDVRSETREKVTGMVRSNVSAASRLLDLHLLVKVRLALACAAVVSAGRGGAWGSVPHWREWCHRPAACVLCT